MFTRAWVNSGYAIDRLADTSGNQNLKYRYNNVGQSPRTIESMVIQNQSDFNGRNVGKSINDIFKPIIEKGDEYYEDFQEYLFHKHNIDRMTLEHKTNGEVKNKPVFGKSVDAENSELVVQTYDQTNPEFKELAEDIYNYNRNLMQYRVDSGLISREQADTLLERYPYYVPTYRAGGQSNTGSFRQSGRRFGVDSTIARAKGSDMDLAPLHEQMVDQTAAVVYNGRINKLLNDIYDSLPPEQKNLALEENTGYDVDSETLDGTGVQPFRVVGNQVAFYRDGKKVTMEVDDGIAYGLRELIPKGNNIAKQFFGGINNAFKSLITTYNPIFVLTNGVRDAGDAALYSANVQGFAKKYPKAWAEIVTDSERFKIYKSLGGFGASRFDDGGNRNYKEHGAVRKYTVDMIEAANYTVEQAPRYAEFLNVLERIKRERGDRTPLTEDLREFSGDDLQKALYAAADITVNFGRGGKWGKLVNAYAVPFFNAAAQGTSRYVRNITKGVRENEGNKAAQVAVVSKNVGSLVLKAAFLGIGGRLLGELMYGDDEEYQEMNERDKSLNFIIKDPTGGDLSGGTGWIRIPVGRAVSFTNDVINRVFHTGKSMYEMATDGKDASASEVLGTLSDQWSGLTAIASETVAPSNPFGENSRIDRPFSNVFLQGTDRNDNKMWNGMPVESQEFENTPINERYNERTTATSKALGNLKIGNKTFSEITGLSPQEMDYLGDSYLGTIWDFATPALTPYAEDNPFKKKFTVDPVMQNRLSSDFYKLKQQAAYKSNNNTESAAGIVSSYYNRVAGEVGQINNQISKIQNSATLSDKEKQTRTRDLREQINGLYRDAIKNEQAYGKAAERNFAELGDKKLAQFKTDKDVFGAEYAIGHYNKDIKEKADFLERKGVSYDDFYNIYFDNVRISKENKKTASYQVERLKTESFLSNSQSLSDDNFGYVANTMGLLNDDSYRKAQNLNHTVNLSYRDFFTAKRQASYIDGEINSRGKQYPGEASDSKRALVMELDDLDGGQQVSLANALGCFSDSQVTKAQTALEEAGIDMKEYFKVYTEVNRIKNQGGTTIEQRKAISDTGLTSQQKIYLNLALSTMTEREASLASVATSLGISDNDFYVIFTNLNGFEADKDANGKSVSGSLRKKSMAYIDSMPISNEQKNFFFNTVAGYSGSPRWGNINFGKQGKGIASFSESELTVDNEGNPINQPTAETASTTSLTPVQQAIHNMMGSFVEKIHQHPETKAISAAITAANAVSSGLSHTPNTNALQQAIWAPFFARVYGDQAASPQEEQSAFTGVTEDNGRFPAEIINAAMQSQIEDGIPAAITLAQWAQESGYGAHMPANSNNPFGITAGRGWTGKTVQGNNAAGTDPATYRVYDSLADAFKDHAAVLKNGYYDIDGLDVSDVDGWIGALQGVYATDPNYGNALRQIIEDNHLSQYTEMAKQYSASSLSAASAPNTIYSPVDISKINTGYPFGAPKTGGRSGTHKGTDFSVPTGTPVTAVADGIVIKAGSNGSAYGNSVLVDMGNGYYYQFNHLSDWGVKAGDTVKAGDIICKSGNTGSNNTGAHLEIEVYQGSPDYGNQIDPVAYFGWGDAEPGTVIHSTDSGNYQSQGGGSGNGSGGSGSSSGSTSQGRGYSSSGIPYAYDGSLYRSSNYRNSRTSLAGNGGRYSFEGRSLPAYQYMGPRNDLFTGNSPAPTESKGKVVYAAPDNGVNRVVVDNGDGTYTSYRNVGEINVKRGDYADESTILAGTNPDQVEVEIIQGNFLINNNDLQAYSRQLGA
ncbi:MAG TPA: peptidoglycan DD-metalloendopeptidase family protein [Firmicutes bacterium]|nr:peptidoglycan DD-metalloendopeptidase family protein [Bacillota bacterium]